MRRPARLALAWSALAALSMACGIFDAEQDEAAAAEPTPAPLPTKASPAPTPSPTPPPGFDPRSTGTRALARFQGGAHAYAAVTTGVSAEGRPMVVYADGDVETLAPDALAPDSLGPGTAVEARIRQWPRFFPGRVERRIGHAVFVRFDDGDERWTSIGLVRVPTTAAAGGTEVSTPPSTVPIPQVGAPVIANYQQRGWYYAGVIVENRADGQVHVIYADGDSEWLPRDQVREDELRRGARVSARPLRSSQTVEAEVSRRVGHAVELQLDDGSKRWVALANVRMR